MRHTRYVAITMTDSIRIRIPRFSRRRECGKFSLSVVVRRFYIDLKLSWLQRNARCRWMPKWRRVRHTPGGRPGRPGDSSETPCNRTRNRGSPASNHSAYRAKRPPPNWSSAVRRVISPRPISICAFALWHHPSFLKHRHVWPVGSFPSTVSHPPIRENGHPDPASPCCYETWKRSFCNIVATVLSLFRVEVNCELTLKKLLLQKLLLYA